jgi:hypothetical protein
MHSHNGMLRLHRLAPHEAAIVAGVLGLRDLVNVAGRAQHGQQRQQHNNRG